MREVSVGGDMEDAKERVRRQYGAVGDAYVHSAEHKSGTDLQRLVELLAPRPHERLLDVATGGGHTALAVAPFVAEVVASDLTPEMLASAEQFISSRGVTNVRYAQADAEELPFPDRSFDIVTCRIAPHHFPSPERFVRESARVLRTGGRFGLLDSTAPEGAIGELLNRFELARDPSHVRSLAESEWGAMLEAAGFVVQHKERFNKRHVFADWTARANLPSERQDEVAHMLMDAGTEVATAFALEIEEGKLVAFTDVKTLFVATLRG
jgi:ubiquinone/menaquinone biosynthesis C-methylase UbiE